MDSEPLVSVVIPTFNRALLLKRCISSVIDQTYQNWELIVVDDGSTDGTSDLIGMYVSADKRVKYFTRPNDRKKGANSCRNIGIKKSNGQYIAFLDSDDEWRKCRLEYAVEFINRTHASAIFSGAVIKDSGSSRIRKSRPMMNEESAFDFILSNDTFAPTPTLIVELSICLEVKFDENLQRHQDFDFFIRTSEVAKWTYFENYDVIINWEGNPGKRDIDFDSCSSFYKNHVLGSINKSVRINYLSYILESCAKLNPSISA